MNAEGGGEEEYINYSYTIGLFLLIDTINLV